MQNFNSTNTRELSFKKHKEYYPPFLELLILPGVYQFPLQDLSTLQYSGLY